MMNKEYEQAIVSASRESDYQDGLMCLTPFLGGKISGNTLESLPKPGTRNTQKLLAGVLLRSGEVQQASRVLTSHSSDEHQISDAVIIDPGLVHLDGHHFNTNVFYKRLAEKLGLTTCILRSMSQHPSLQNNELDSIRAFALSPYEKLFPDNLKMSGLCETNRLFEFDFQRVLPKDCPRLLIVHTARHSFIEGFCNFLNNYYVAPARVMIGIIETDALTNANPVHEEIRGIYYRSFAILKSIPGLELMVVVETEEVASFLRATTGDWLDIQVMSYVAGYLDEIPDEALMAGNVAPVIGFVGQTRAERGAFIIPEIAMKTLMNSVVPCSWKAQLNVDALHRHSTSDLDRAMAWLENSTGFKKIDQNLPLASYYQLLATIDIMVMPYSSRYNTTGSGVNIESLKFGHIQVVPEGSSMASIANEYGSGVVTYSDPSPLSVCEAIFKALQQFDVLRKSSLHAAKTFCNESDSLLHLKTFFQRA